MRNYKRKTDRQSWQEHAMAAAINACINGGIGYLKASKLYSVPRSTLKDRIKRAKSGKSIIEAAGKGLGRYNTVFSTKQEEVLKSHIMDIEPKLYELTSTGLRKIAYQFAMSNNVKHNFNNETQKAGLDWLRGFITRHPDTAFFINRTPRMPKWSKHSIILLIELYKENPCLYDIQSEFYHNEDERKKAVRSIAVQLQKARSGTTDSDVKAKLESLTSAYLSVRKKIETSFIQGTFLNNMCPASLWYYDTLSFLASYESTDQYFPVSKVLANTDDYIKTEQLEEETLDTELVPSTPLVFTQLDSPYFVQIKSPLPTTTVANTENIHAHPPVLRQYMSAKAKRALQNEPLGIPPADDLKSTSFIAPPDSIDQFISYVGARLKRIKSKEILQELEDDILLKIMQSERDDRNRLL